MTVKAAPTRPSRCVLNWTVIEQLVCAAKLVGQVVEVTAKFAGCVVLIRPMCSGMPEALLRANFAVLPGCPVTAENVACGGDSIASGEGVGVAVGVLVGVGVGPVAN